MDEIKNEGKNFMGWCSMYCTWSYDSFHGTTCKDCCWTCNRMGDLDDLEVNGDDCGGNDGHWRRLLRLGGFDGKGDDCGATARIAAATHPITAPKGPPLPPSRGTAEGRLGDGVFLVTPGEASNKTPITVTHL